MNSITIEPSEDYDMLVRQFRALQRLLESRQNQLIVVTRVNADLTRQLLEVNSDVLASERQANQELTNQVLGLEQEVVDLKFEIRALQEGAMFQ